MKEPLVTIIMVVFKDRNVIANGLQVIENSDYMNLEIIIVDNQGNDGSMSIVYDWIGLTRRNVRVVNGSADHCQSKAENIGLQNSTGDYILILSPDNILVDGKWLSLLVKTTMECSDAAIACPTVLNKDMQTIQTTGSTSWFHTFSRNKYKGQSVEVVTDLGVREVNDMPIGVVYLFRRDVGLKVGGYDEKICPTIFDETDFIWRVRISGGRIYWCPTSLIAHIGGHSFGELGRDLRTKTSRRFDAYKHGIRTVIKNSSLVTLPAEIMLLILPGLSRDTKTSVLSFAKAIVWNLRSLDEIVSRRREIRGR